MTEVFTHTVQSDTFTGTLSVPTGLFIDGEFVDSATRAAIECVFMHYSCSSHKLTGRLPDFVIQVSS